MSEELFIQFDPAVHVPGEYWVAVKGHDGLPLYDYVEIASLNDGDRSHEWKAYLHKFNSEWDESPEFYLFGPAIPGPAELAAMGRGTMSKPDCWRLVAHVKDDLSCEDRVQYTFIHKDMLNAGLLHWAGVTHREGISAFNCNNNYYVLCRADGTPKAVEPPPPGLEVRE